MKSFNHSIWFGVPGWTPWMIWSNSAFNDVSNSGAIASETIATPSRSIGAINESIGTSGPNRSIWGSVIVGSAFHGRSTIMAREPVQGRVMDPCPSRQGIGDDTDVLKVDAHIAEATARADRVVVRERCASTGLSEN